MASIRDVIARLRVDDKKLTPELRRARNKWKKFGKGVKRDLTRSFSKAAGVLKTAVGVGGIVGLVTVGKDVIDFETKLKRLEIQAGKSRASLGDLRAKIDQISNATGQSRQALLDTAARFVALTGDAEGARNNLDLFARVATGTGASLEDIAGAAVAVSKQFGGIDASNMEKVFDVLIVQGNKGSVEVKQVAEELGQLGGLFRAVGRDGAEGMADLGAAFQVVQTEFGFDPAKARTGLNSFFTQLLKKRKQIKKATGVDVIGKGGARKDVIDILDELKAKGVGVSELLDGLGEAKAARAGNALIVNLELLKSIREESLKTKAVQEQFRDFNQSSAGRMKRSWEQVKNQLAGLFTAERIAEFARLMEELVVALEFVIENVRAFAAAWAALKISSFTLQVAGAAKGVAGLSSSMGLAAGSVGVLSAALAGFSIGTALDQWLGISDAISKYLTNLDRVDARAHGGLLRSQAGLLGGASGAGGAAVRAQIAAGGLTAEQRNAAVKLADEAERQGVVGKGGKIDRAAAQRVALSGVDTLDIPGLGGADKITDNLLSALEIGLVERAKARGASFAGDVDRAGKTGEQISIKVEGQFRMDEKGLVTMEKPRVKRDRRGVTQ